MNNKFTEILFGGFLVGLLKVLIVICVILFVIGLVFIGNLFDGGGDILPYVSLYGLGIGFFDRCSGAAYLKFAIRESLDVFT